MATPCAHCGGSPISGHFYLLGAYQAKRNKPWCLPRSGGIPSMYRAFGGRYACSPACYEVMLETAWWAEREQQLGELCARKKEKELRRRERKAQHEETARHAA